MNSIGSRGWKILSHYLRVEKCFQELVMLNIQYNAHPGCSAVVMAVTSALPRSAQLAERLGLYKLAFFRRKYKRVEMPFASLEILICTFDLDHSLMLERQISDGRFPSLRRLQMPAGYCLDMHGRIYRAVCALERTMKYVHVDWHAGRLRLELCNHPADRIDTGTPESTLALRRVLPTPKRRAGMHTHALCTIITS